MEAVVVCFLGFAYLCRMSNFPRPVTLLTGFLGAGKTTFLNACLTYRKGIRFAILENELGEEGIDGDLLIRSEENLVEMSNGCICCTLNDNMLDVLTDLHQRSEQWDELLIEATGIADPAGVAVPFLNAPLVRNAYQLQRTICLVDPNLIEEQLEETEEAIRQVVFSDIILINKIDLADEKTIERVSNLLGQLNPLAKIFRAKRRAYPLKEIFDFVRELDETQTLADAPVFSFFNGPANFPQGPAVKTMTHSNIAALGFRFEEAFDIQKLAHRLNAFLLFQAKGIYRIKGVVYDSTQSEKIVVQSVGKQFSLVKAENWKDEEERISRIVIIGRDIKRPGLEKMLREGLRKD